MNKSTNFVYEYMGNIYINLTNRCSNACSFCVRNNGEGVAGDNLWLEYEPTTAEVIAQLDKVLMMAQASGKNIKEIIFCGYGEPTYRLDQLLETADYAKSKGLSVRLNTNGLGNIINDANIVFFLKQSINSISVSLNASNKSEYDRLCKSEFGINSFDYVLDFIKKCVATGFDVTASAIDSLPKDSIDKCRDIAKSLGAKFRVRELI